jgi:PAS domain S-box-containing protein
MKKASESAPSSKRPTIRILHLEDEPDFCRLVSDFLAADGIKAEVVIAGDLTQFNTSLEEGRFDIILADFQVPNGTGMEALKQATHRCPETPFVLVSGVVNEQLGIQALKDGATDFVLKQSLGRLPSVVRRAIEQASEKARLSRVESELASERKRAEARLRLQSLALEAAANAIVITDRKGAAIWANPAFSKLTGYAREEMIGQNPRLLKSGQHGQEFYRHLWQTVLAGKVWQSEMVNRHKDGHLYTEEATITPVLDERGTCTHFIAIKQDISERKRAEAELQQTHQQLVAASKQAAVAEFATSILHNVGNVLNSVGVASECLAQSLKQSKSTRLSQAVELMLGHRDELGGFFKDHPKGKLVLGYLSQLA